MELIQTSSKNKEKEKEKEKIPLHPYCDWK